MSTATGRPRLSGAGGQSTVEFALLLPVVVALAAAVLQVAVIGRDQLMVVHAAREAARVASVDPDVRHVRSAARRVVPDADVELGARPPIGEPIGVRVRRRITTHVPLLGALAPELTVTATATVIVER